MARKTRYEVVQQGAGFTPAGPTPDRVLVRSSSMAVARRGFDLAGGTRILVRIDPDGTRTEVARAIA